MVTITDKHLLAYKAKGAPGPRIEVPLFTASDYYIYTITGLLVAGANGVPALWVDYLIDGAHPQLEGHFIEPPLNPQLGMIARNRMIKNDYYVCVSIDEDGDSRWVHGLTTATLKGTQIRKLLNSREWKAEP